MPKITVIVTTHHRPDYLFRCLLSVKLQTFTDFECIVVADNCPFALKVFEENIFIMDDRFEFYSITTTKKNTGELGKNEGIRQSKAPYICYCDDDNILLPNHLGALYNGMQLGKQLVYSRFININYQKASPYNILKNDLYYKGEENNSYITNKDLLAMCHTKQLSQEVGGWKSMLEVGYNIDGYFMRKMKEHIKNEFVELKEVTAIYNEHWVDIDNMIKEHPEYKKQLSELRGVYVYPELVERFKKKYL